MDLKETEILGDDIKNHWYYKSKAIAMVQFIDKPFVTSILDVGAGSGFFSRELLKNSCAEEAWCVDISYESDKDELENGKPVYSRRNIKYCTADIVLLMDVLEHVDDDVGLLKEYIEKVPSGTFFLITVPAFQFLWSGHDDFLEHKRRYTLSHLERVIQESGLQTNRISYYFGMIFPIVSITRIFQKLFQRNRKSSSQLSKHSAVINFILSALCYIELPFMKLNKIAGLSVFCLAQKK